MLKEAIQEIVKLAGPKVFTIGGENFASEELARIDPKKDFPKCIRLTGLDSLCKLIRNEADRMKLERFQILVQVGTYNTVKVFTTLDDEMDRRYLYECTADTRRRR